MKQAWSLQKGLLTLRAIGSRFLFIGCLLGIGFPSAWAASLAIQVDDKHQLILSPDAFGKDYLLSMSRIPQQAAPTSTGLAGKIVIFERFHDSVDMYEATDGLVVTEDLPARRLLATFAVLEETDKGVVIDFNLGMRRLFTQIWYGSGGSRDVVLEVPQSRVFASEIADNRLVLRQSVQARDRDMRSNMEQRFEVRYFLEPYESSVGEGKEQGTPDNRYVRYFDVSARLEPVTGRSSSKIIRFDITRPITFYYSANTPANYVDSVTAGILYWNRAFGTNIVRAEKAPEGVTAPDSRHNIIQWVPWDSAGSAYADVLADPRTGEAKHGQAYMTSVFAVGGRSRARAVLRSLWDLIEASQKQRGGDSEKSGELDLGVPWFHGDSLCQSDPLDFAVQYAKGLEEILSNEDLTDEVVLRVSQDYVLKTVAHEVGHVLGLRHNFAGSIENTITLKELDDFFKAYVSGEDLDKFSDKLASTSIMEYGVFKARLFNGWRIRTNAEPLPHDRAAIQWGYFGSQEPIQERMLFGTDDHVGVYGDVDRNDQGPDPVVAAYEEVAEQLRQLPNSLIERFIAARAPRDSRDRIPLTQVNLSVRGYASGLVGPWSRMLRWFEADTRSLKVENDFEFIGDLNRKERHKAHWDYLVKQIETLGGLDRTLFALLPVDWKLEMKKHPDSVQMVEKLDVSALTARLKKLLDSPAYTEFVGLDNEKYSFTDEEKALILERGTQLFEELELEVIYQACQRLENAQRDLGREALGGVGDSDLIAQMEKRLIELARRVILAKDDKKRIKGQVTRSYVEVVDFKYKHSTRLAAARMLNDRVGSFRGWALDAKADLNKSLKGEVDNALNIPNLKEFKESMLSRALREWYLQQQDILQLLPARPGTGSSPTSANNG